MNSRQTVEKNTALYERLSRDDEIAGDSNSIRNQKSYLESYAAEHGFSNCVHYTDDGWSGGNFERPSWKRLIADIEAGKIGTVIAKDMSRIGREYLQTGFYTEVFFRKHGVRFIAIGNGIDSNDQSTGEFAPILNVMNEFYLKDCSKKIKAAYQVRAKAGKRVANNAIYGYKKDPQDKHQWLIDEEAAAVVKRIYQMAVNGDGPAVIARKLREDHIEKPSVYLAKRGCGTKQKDADMSRPYDWSCTTVADMIEKPEYMGHTVNFRNYKESYKDKRVLKHSPDEWMVIENTHEAIVDAETWKLAQQTRKVIHRIDTTGFANPLTGLMFCADCGGKMYNHRHSTPLKRIPSTIHVSKDFKIYESDHYECSTYNRCLSREHQDCWSHHISTKVLYELILETIRITSQYAIANQEEFVQKVREASEIKQATAAKELKKQIAKAKRRSDELEEVIRKLYESFALGKITENRFDALIAGYEKEQAEAKALIETEQTQLDAYVSDTNRADAFLALAKRYTDFSELTPQMIYEFVEKIVVHSAEKVDGVKTQEIEIYLKYIGKFDAPLPAPTPEELKKMARKQKRKETDHARYVRQKQEKEQEAEEPEEAKPMSA